MMYWLTATEPTSFCRFSIARAERTFRVSGFSLRVVDARNPSRQRESGKAKQTVHYVGDFLIRTPIGEMPAQRVEVNFIADLQFADAKTTSVIYVAQGLGRVVQQRLLTVKVLGLSARRQLETLLLTSEPSEDTAVP